MTGGVASDLSSKCILCSSFKGKLDERSSVPSPTAAPYKPFMKAPVSSSSLLPPTDPFGSFQPPKQCTPSDYISSIPSFIPSDPHLLSSSLAPTHAKAEPFDEVSSGGAGDIGGGEGVDLPPYFGGHILDESSILEKNLNAVRIDLKTRVSDVFRQIMLAISAHQETLNHTVDEKFADIGERLSAPGKEIKSSSSYSDITAEVYKVTEEINAKLAEAKLMIEVINSLESKKSLSAFLSYLSSTGAETIKGDSSNPGVEDLTPVTDTTLSKPMIRSWSDSTSQSAVLITWTTPRDFELLHRSEGFWYELEQRLASEPDTAWRNVYKGVERTYVCKNMRRGTKYLFRCCVCVARHRYSLWSPEVLIVPGSGYPNGKQNFVAPEISKALEQEVARSFTSGAVSAAGSSTPAVVTTVIVPIGTTHPSSSSSSSSSSSTSSSASSSPVIPVADLQSSSSSASSLSFSPSLCSGEKPTITTITTDSIQAASAIVSASSSSASASSLVSPSTVLIPEADHRRERKQKGLPLNWNSFVSGPFYELSQSNRVVTALEPNAIVLGHVFPKNRSVFVSVQILRGTGIFLGVAPAGMNQSVVQQHLYQGWFLETSSLSIGSRPPYKWKAKPAYPRGDLTKQNHVYFPHEGDIITMNFNSKTNTLRFSTMPGTYLSGKYTGLLTSSSKPCLVPAIVLLNPGDSVLFHSAVQCSV